MSTGEAAGTAAALSVKERVSPRELDGKLVKNLLEKNGVNIRPDENSMPKKCMLD
jgi:hypothetical protein